MLNFYQIPFIYYFLPLENARIKINDPPETGTDEFLREQVDCEVPTEIFVEIDGRPVKNPLQYFEESPLFDVQLTENNIFGATPEDVPELKLSPCVDSGYYIFLPPLPPGEHVIDWSATWSRPFGEDPFTEDVIYDITLSSGRR